MPVATLASRAPVRPANAPTRSASRTSMRAGRFTVPARRAMAGPPLVHLQPSRTSFGGEPVPDLVRQLVASPGAGEILPSRIQTALEESFDVSLQPVRVHLDRRANAAAESLGARAFTFGSHVFLGPEESPTDLALMGHEVAHVVQQQGGPVLQTYTSPAAGGDFEHEAHRASAAAQRGERSPVQGRTGGPTVQAQAQPGFFQRGWNALRRGARAVVQFAEDAGWALLNRFAPELVPIMRRGPLEWLKEKISSAVEALLDTLMSPVRAIRGVASSLMGSFTNLLNWLQEAATGIAQGNCRALSQAAGKIHQVFDAVVGPVIEPLKNAAKQVKNFFSGLWDRFGAPVWRFLQRIGGRAWELIQQFGRWIWEKTEPIRRGMSHVWTWIKNRLGIGEGAEGQDGIFQWVQRRVQAAWDQFIKPFIERYKRPLLVVAAILIMLSPAGPFIALGGAIAGVAAGVRWIRQNLTTRDGVVNARTYLERTLIPNILNGVNRVSSFLMEKARSITDGLRNVVSGLNQSIGAVAGTILNFVVGFLQWILDRFQELVRWAMEKLVGFATWVGSVFQGLVAFLQPVLNFLRRVGAVVADVMRLPYELGSRIWNAIPACIRDPFIDFFIPLLLRQIPFFRELAGTPEAWRETRAQVMGLVRQIFRDFDLLGAIRTAFRIVVRALRIPTDLVAQLLDKAARAWDAVIAAPLRFIENSLKAILRGVGRFMRNFLSHLWYGVQGWLLNAVEQSGTGIRPPARWEPRAIFVFVLDVLGISIDHLFELLARRVGRPVVDRIRRAINFLTGVWEWVKVAIEEGAAGLWRMVADRLGNLARMVLESAVSWVMTRIIAIVSVRLTAMAASAGFSAILEAIVAVYQAIQTALEYARRILEIMLLVFNTVIQIAQGVIDPAAQAVERGLRMAMPIVIGFLANYAGLGGIGGRIREIILAVRARVDAAILWLIDRALAAGRWLLDRLRAGVAAVVQWWRKRKEFRTRNGVQHALYFQREGRTARLIVNPAPPKGVIELLDEYPRPGRTAREDSAIREARAAMVELGRIQPRQINETETGTEGRTAEIDPLMVRLCDALKELNIGGTVRPTRVVYAGSARGATRVTAAPLTQIPGNTRGSERATGEPPGWDYAQLVNSALPRNESGNRSIQWDRAHLLSYRFHGPGHEAWNLTPANKGANRLMTTFEERFQSVFNRDAAGQEFWYKTIATYNRQPPAESIPSTIQIDYGRMDNLQSAVETTEPIPVAEPTAALRPASINTVLGEPTYFVAANRLVPRRAIRFMLRARSPGVPFTPLNLHSRLRAVDVQGSRISDAGIRAIESAIDRGDFSY